MSGAARCYGPQAKIAASGKVKIGPRICEMSDLLNRFGDPRRPQKGGPRISCANRRVDVLYNVDMGKSRSRCDPDGLLGCFACPFYLPKLGCKSPA